MTATHHIGQRLSYDGAVCTVRYAGPVAGTTGSWLGVEWDDITRGKHDGSHKGTRYFSCVSRAHSAASFVRPTRPADAPQSFVAALHDKYVLDSGSSRPRERIYFSTKLAEEVGFDKIWRQQSQLQKLRIVVLENARVAAAGEAVAATCPMITQLDLSRNLFEGLGPVVDICGDLQYLQKLTINGNRFRNVLEDDALSQAGAAFAKVTELALADTMLGWEELVYVAAKFPALTALLVGTNQLSSLPRLSSSSPAYHATAIGHLATTLTSISLEFNDFCSISEIASLAELKALRSIFLKGNSISSLEAPRSPEDDDDDAAAAAAASISMTVFPHAVEYLDLCYNKVASWGFVDGLTAWFPGLTALRISHNPIYEDVAEGASSDDAFMFTIARIAQLKTLNFSAVTAADRSNAEMFYLSRIARQLAVVPEAAERSVTALHPRWEELCALYGRPDVVRREEMNPSFLEARLIHVDFYSHDGTEERTARMCIPKSFDVYRVRGIAGRLFGLAPLEVRLVWETGDWDPVAGFDEDGDDDGDEEESEGGDGMGAAGGGADEAAEDRPGRWVKREVELKDGPKLLGYCVDGTKVTIRVERAID